MRLCRECGTGFKGLRADATFCRPACRRDYNARRAKRGAQLYDLFMIYRYERELAGRLGIWAKLCRMAQDFRQEDTTKRQGRYSWDDAKTVLMRHPTLSVQHLPTTRIGRGS